MAYSEVFKGGLENDPHSYLNYWSEDNSIYTFNNHVGPGLRIVLTFGSLTKGIDLIDPYGEALHFYTDGDEYVLEYHGVEEGRELHNSETQITIEILDNQIIFEWDSGSINRAFIQQYYYYDLQIIDELPFDFRIDKDFDEIDQSFISGRGYNSLETYSKNNKIFVNSGYFYIESQEYYFFCDMKVCEISMTTEKLDIPDYEEFEGSSEDHDYYVVDVEDYQLGAPYFLVPEENIDNELGLIKTPSNLNYDVVWDVKNNKAYIKAAGIVEEDDLKLVYEGSSDPYKIDPIGDITGGDNPIPLIHDNTNLVLFRDEPDKIYNLDIQPAWLGHVHQNKDFIFYAHAEDQYGSIVENLEVEVKKLDEEDESPVDVLLSENTDLRGAAFGKYNDTYHENGFHIWSQIINDYGDIDYSLSQWIQVPLEKPIVKSEVFQLDNPGVFFDTQAARTAMGMNIWGERFGINSGESTGITTWPTRGDWETEYEHYKRPPYGPDVVTDGPADPENDLSDVLDTGYFNIWDYVQYKGIEDNYDVLSEAMRVGVNGYWGQLLIRGEDLENIKDDCQNPGIDIYYLRRISSYNGYNIFGSETHFGSFNDLFDGDNIKEEYKNEYYVCYDHGDYDSTGEFYFRGIAIYPISPGVEYFEQNWIIRDIISIGRLSI